VDRTKTNKLSLKIGLWATGVGVFLYILIVSFLFFSPKLKSYKSQTAFESTKWKLHLSDGDFAKQTMVDDLLSRYQLVGMTRANIEELLGTPQSTNYFKDYDYVYWLGPERSVFAIDSEWLGIKFNDDMVVKAEIIID